MIKGQVFEWLVTDDQPREMVGRPGCVHVPSPVRAVDAPNGLPPQPNINRDAGEPI
jgi:hypothetical protein